MDAKACICVATKSCKGVVIKKLTLSLHRKKENQRAKLYIGTSQRSGHIALCIFAFLKSVKVHSWTKRRAAVKASDNDILPSFV